MFDYLNARMLKASMDAKDFVNDFKNNEGGFEVVQVVLILVVAVIAIAAFQGEITGYISDLWDIIINNTPS